MRSDFWNSLEFVMLLDDTLCVDVRQPQQTSTKETRDMVTAERVCLRFGDSAEEFLAPPGYTLTEAVVWLGRNYDPTCHRLQALTPGAVWIAHNGRRGVQRRSCVIRRVLS